MSFAGHVDWNYDYDCLCEYHFYRVHQGAWIFMDYLRGESSIRFCLFRDVKRGYEIGWQRHHYQELLYGFRASAVLF